MFGLTAISVWYVVQRCADWKDLDRQLLQLMHGLALSAFEHTCHRVTSCSIPGSSGHSDSLYERGMPEPAASTVTVPSGTLHITNLHVDSEFVVVAKVDDVVAAAAGASGTS